MGAMKDGLDNSLLIEIIRKCLEIRDIDKRLELVHYLNKLLPLEYKFRLPPFVTNDWINKRLYSLEEKIL